METDLISVRVVRKRFEAQGICLFELVGCDGELLPQFTAGAHIDVHLPGVTRQYSLCNSPQERHRYQIAVLKTVGSRGGSIAMHDSVSEGDVLRIGMPRNHFPLAPLASYSLLLAGGIGVTPLLSMAEQLASCGSDFEMHYCTRNEACTAFLNRLGAVSYAARVHLHRDDRQVEKLDMSGLLASMPEGSHLYVCGPTGFIDQARQVADRMGWPASRLHYELFAAPSPAAPAAADGSFEVRIASTGRAYAIPPGQSITDVLREQGVDIPVSCEQGVCGTCLTRVLEGIPDHRDAYLTPEEQACNDQCTPCCSRSRSTYLVLDL